jgi:protease I
VLQGSKGKESATVDNVFGDVSPQDFEAMLIPGGSSPDKLRAYAEAVTFVEHFMTAGKPTLAICHGPAAAPHRG